MSKSKPKPQVKSTFETPSQEINKEFKSNPTTITTPKNLLFGTINYQLMALGLVVILVGYLLMLGTNNTVEGGVYPADELYSFRRTILSSFVIILGFVIEIVAIIKSKKEA